MLYLPDSSYMNRFKALSWPLPPGLIPWLFKRGLAIYVLPESEDKAIKILLRVVGSRLLTNPFLVGDGRLAYKTAHYLSKENCIIIPHEAFYRGYGENVLLHEIGHAIDFNYINGANNILSSSPDIWKALRVKKQLNQYCADKLKQTGLQLEQFACSFVAFFQEPDSSLPDSVSTVDNLSPELIRFFKNNIMDYFQ